MTTTPSRPGLAWAGLDTHPTGFKADVAARIARRLFRGAVRRLPVTVTERFRDRSPTGSSTSRIGTGGPSMTIHRPEEFYARIGRDGLIGFGEAYLTGAWEAEDLGGFLTVLAADLPRLIPEPLQKLRKAYVRRPPEAPAQHPGQHPREHLAPLDLSNEMFRVFLDDTLSYSSALFDTSCSPGLLLQAAPPEISDDEPRRGPGAQDRPPARPGRRDRGHPGAGDRHRLGRAGDPGGPPRCHRALGHPLQRAARARRGAHRRCRVRRPRARRAERLPRRVTGTLRRRCARWRWSRRSGTSTGRRTSRPSTGSSPRAARWGSRRSRCRTTGCSPPGTRGPGSTSTSSPAASCPRSRRSTRSPAPTPRLRITEQLSFGPALRRDAAPLGHHVHGRSRAGARTRLRRDLPADVALLPGVLAGRLRLGLHRRAAARAREARGDGALVGRASDPHAVDRAGAAPAARGRAAPLRGRRPAGAAARLGRQRGRAGGPAAGRAALPRRGSPPAVAPGRARRRPGLRHRRARGARRPRRRAHPRLVGGRGPRPVRCPPVAVGLRPGPAHRPRRRRRRHAASARPPRRPAFEVGGTARSATAARSATTTTSPTSSTP